MIASDKFKKITVFCGSSKGNQPLYRESVEQLAIAIAAADMTLVYGGAKIGLMGVLADKVLECGGQVIGVITRSLAEVEVVHQGLTDLHMVNSMHERKALMAKLSDGFMMLPGGPGSLDEFFEVFTWAKLGYHAKPCAILNINHYYDDLIRLLDHTVKEGFLSQMHRDMVLMDESPTTLLQKCMDYQAPSMEKRIKERLDLDPL